MTLWKRTLIAIAAACTVSVSYAAPVELDSVKVIVNEGVILQSDIDASMKTLRANAKKSGQTLPSQDVLNEQVLE
ncbi:MAG TPA: peptidylprolyl isomerase SurA, partial [Vibrio sp.]|nr:peptidylprolyl isomerase SurA [Vibrio sp.]